MTHLGPSLRRRKRTIRPWQRVGVALGVSIALNLLFLWQIQLDWLSKKVLDGQPRAIALAPLSAEQWEANRGGGRPSSLPTPIAPPVPPRPPEPPRPPGQVVEVAPSKNDTPPKDARFASDRDNTVEKETRARVTRTDNQRTLPRPSAPTAKPSAGEAVAQHQGGSGQAGTTGDGRRAGNEGKGKSGATREELSRQRLALKLDNDGRYSQRAEPSSPGSSEPEGQGGEGGLGARPGKSGALDPGKLRPSASFYDRLAGGPAADHLEDVEEGEGTYLNTREWKYAGYFNRIKQSVGANWDPSKEVQARDPTGNSFGYKDRVTVLAVTLNERGTLTDVVVHKTSGVDFLDRTAVDAFRRAQPFVNPPQGLADQRGEIKFTFGFYLEFGSPGLRLFRGPAPQ